MVLFFLYVPFLSGVLLTAIIDGRIGLRAFFGRMFRWRVGLQWYAIAQGMTNPEIAQQLGLSVKTVSNYISNVLVKLQAADRAKLMLMALEAGMGKGQG